MTRNFALVLSTTLLLAACGGELDDEGNADTADIEYGTHPPVLPLQAAAPDAAAKPHLTYYGGPVISNVKVYKVQYGSGTYQSFITGTGASSMAGFYTGVTNSAYFDW